MSLHDTAHRDLSPSAAPSLWGPPPSRDTGSETATCHLSPRSRRDRGHLKIGPPVSPPPMTERCLSVETVAVKGREGLRYGGSLRPAGGGTQPGSALLTPCPRPLADELAGSSRAVHPWGGHHSEGEVEAWGGGASRSARGHPQPRFGRLSHPIMHQAAHLSTLGQSPQQAMAEEGQLTRHRPTPPLHPMHGAHGGTECLPGGLPMSQEPSRGGG